ncbi:MAG TPA: hydrogenase maturation protease [Chloroflexota bacterium]|nr:hydrogenase maturation protease [Chloroflexota bacterium]HUM68563.1 hydrogenase maturation protease [Chloroflexota bacterium]
MDGQTMTDNKTLVVGLGNPILGDDGVGWRVAEAVKELRPSVEVDCLALGGLSLMERLVGYDRAIIVDAMHTGHGRTGTVTTFPLSDLPDRSAGHTTAVHDLSLPTALTLGRQMGAQLPEEITIVGIEAERVYDFSEELSTAVQDAIPVAVTAVLTAIEA